MIYNIKIYIALSLNNYYGKCQYHCFIAISLNDSYCHILTFRYLKLKAKGSPCHMFCVIRYYYYMAKPNCRRNYRMKSLHFENRSNILIMKVRFRLNLLLIVHCTLLSSAKIKQYFNRSVDNNTVDLFMENIGLTLTTIFKRTHIIDSD